jgi:hypothetical protein
LPSSLRGPLHAHLERVRSAHRADLHARPQPRPLRSPQPPALGARSHYQATQHALHAAVITIPHRTILGIFRTFTRLRFGLGLAPSSRLNTGRPDCRGWRSLFCTRSRSCAPRRRRSRLRLATRSLTVGRNRRRDLHGAPRTYVSCACLQRRSH